MSTSALSVPRSRRPAAIAASATLPPDSAPASTRTATCMTPRMGTAVRGSEETAAGCGPPPPAWSPPVPQRFKYALSVSRFSPVIIINPPSALVMALATALLSSRACQGASPVSARRAGRRATAVSGSVPRDPPGSATPSPTTSLTRPTPCAPTWATAIPPADSVFARPTSSARPVSI